MCYMATGKKTPTIESKALTIAIKRAMATRSVKVPGLAKTSGIPYGTLRKILELNTVADYEQMAKIADALHMPLSKIIEDAEKLATDPDIIAEFNEEYGTDIPLPGPTEQEIIDSMLRQLKEDPYSLAALRDPNKEIEMRGDAGPDWDDPA